MSQSQSLLVFPFWSFPPFLPLLPFLFQAIAISIDEFYFHRKRGLRRWELISHPVDTLCLLACLAFALTQSYNALNLKIYFGLALLSCLLVTKDEAVHRLECTAAECWLHSVLFLVHPLVLIDIAFLWANLGANLGPNFGKDSTDGRSSILGIFFVAAAFFLFYQIAYGMFKAQRITSKDYNES